MTQSHAQVVPVTIVDDADIHHWPKGEDISLRLIKAVADACKAEPSLNATFNSQNTSRRLLSEINIGIAVDTPAGLYVPVIKNTESKDDKELRASLNQFKEQAKKQEFPPEDLKGIQGIIVFLF